MTSEDYEYDHPDGFDYAVISTYRKALRKSQLFSINQDGVVMMNAVSMVLIEHKFAQAHVEASVIIEELMTHE